MISFIIYEQDNQIRRKYEHVIYSFIGKHNEKFHIFNYTDHKYNTYSRSIYILSSKSIKKALSIAKDIRTKENYYSQIIIITDKNQISVNLLHNRLMVLDYIKNNSNMYNNLKSAITNAYEIINCNSTFSFTINGEIHKLQYKDILYIEKSNNQNYCSIHTTNNDFIIKDTINNLESILDCNFFFKTHRSCIVNIYNIKQYDLYNNLIYFVNNKKIDLVSRDKRKLLKEKLLNKEDLI